MKMLFKKRRYYQGSFRDPGTVMEVDAYYARAFQHIGAAIPAITVEKKETEQQNLLSSKLTRTTPSVKQEEKEFEEGELDALPDGFGIQSTDG